MSLALSTKKLHDFTPKFYEGEENPRVYGIEVPTVIGTRQLREDLYKAGYRVVSPQYLNEVLRMGVEETIAESDQAEWLEAIDVFESYQPGGVNAPIRGEIKEGEAKPEPMPRRVKVLYETISMEVGAHYVPYRTALANAKAFEEAYPEFAVRKFLKTVKNASFELEVEGGVLNDDSYNKIPPQDALMIVGQIFRLLKVSGDEEKNLPSPSQSAPTQTNMTAE